MPVSSRAAVYFCVFSFWFSSLSAVNLPSRGAAVAADLGARRVIVKFRESGTKSQGKHSTALAAEFANLMAKTAPISVFPFSEKRINSLGSAAFEGVRVIEYTTEEEADDFVSAALQSDLFEYVELDHRLELFETPNDELFHFQWNLQNTGQLYYSVLRVDGDDNDMLIMRRGSEGADIQFPETVEAESDAKIVVAIIDTGLDRDHPDLNGKIWQNADEVPGNNVDDDHNGYVDDTWGWDFSANESSIPIFSDNDPNDIFGHGTHCAGIVAAATSNSMGIAGISKNSKLMTLKIHPTMSVSLAAKAIIYAADNGADVVNMSWGMVFESLLLRDALLYARERGVVLCAATGNTGAGDVIYPAAYEFVIGVGASTSKDDIAEFSTFGHQVDLCAPGESILSLRAGDSDLYGIPPSNEPFVHVIDDLYYEASGTSMACPHVAAAAAEMRAKSAGLKIDRIEEILYATSNDLLDPRREGASYPGWDKYSGYGRMNLAQALANTPTTQARIEQPREGAIVTGNIQVSGEAIASAGLEYSLKYRAEGESEWTPIRTGPANINSGLVAEFDPAGKSGLIELRLEVGDDNVAYRTILLVPNAAVEIRLPHGSEASSGGMELGLSSICPNFERTIVAYRPVIEGGTWTKIAELTSPSFGDQSLFWSHVGLSNGEYAIRAQVFSTAGLEAEFEDRVEISSRFSGGKGWRRQIGANATIMANYGDFNGDGRNEIIVGTDAGLAFFDSEGTRDYAVMPGLPEEKFLVAPAVCSIDGDGIDDLVFLSETTNKITVVGSSSGIWTESLFSPPRTLHYSASSESFFPILFARDLDRDGHDEVFYKPGGNPVNESELRIFSPGATGGSCFPLMIKGGLIQAGDLDCDSVDELYVLGLNNVLTKYNLCGDALASSNFNFGSAMFTVSGLSTADANGDGRYDLVVMGTLATASLNYGYFELIMDSELRVLDRRARHLGIPGFLDPPMAVFGDIDGDGSPESVVSLHDGSFGYLFAWDRKGEPFLEEQPMRGLLGASLHPGISSMPLLVDVDDNPGAEAVVAIGRDMFATFPLQRFDAYKATGERIEGWPWYSSSHSLERASMANIPTFGDIDGDGITDMLAITPENELIFTSLEGVPWDENNSPCPMWRYNRKLDNVAPLRRDVSTDADDEIDPLPREFVTVRNFPNPFNAATTIEYSIPNSGDVILNIYNLSGQLVRELTVPAQTAGRHRINWEAKDRDGSVLPSGIYFYRVESKNISATGKMVLVK